MRYFELVIYVPATHAEAVKTAVFAAGAGRQGNYDCCCFSAAGTGEFRPLAGSKPFLGETGKRETVAEVRLEMICAEDRIAAAVAALRKAHPYETPAFHYYPVEIE